MIEPRYAVLQTLFADRVFRIPHYQRFYSWQKRQRDDLFGDLRKLASSGEDQHHFMATVVCHKTEETKNIGMVQYRVYDVVDGQQRLTTLILLIKSIEMALPETSESRKDLAKTLVKSDGHLILLQTNNANEFLFNRYIRDGIAPNADEIQTHSDRNLAGAIRECKQFCEGKTEAELVALLRLLIQRLGFVVFDTEDRRVVYTIFEVLNSRGLAVDWIDKTKSVLMGRTFELGDSLAATDAEMQALQNIWGEVYRQIAKEDVPGDEILRITATLYYGPGQGKPRSAEESLDLLRKECVNFDKPRQISMRLLDVARKLVELYGSPHLGPVTEILHARLLAVAIKSAKGVNEQERGKLLDQWERITFRIFGLCNKDSRTKVGDYVRLAAKIVTEDMNTRTYNEIMAGLRELGSGSDYQIEKALSDGLQGKDFYARAEECRYLLWSYEEYLARSTGGGGTIDENEKSKIWKLRAIDSIEHVFPQTPSAGWAGKMVRSEDGIAQSIEANVNRIGNLLLLPIAVNQQAQNFPFDEKKKVYIQHNLRMVQQVCQHDDWTFSEIDKREAQIVAWAKNRWGDL